MIKTPQGELGDCSISPDVIPLRLEKLMKRVAQLTPGMAYTLTLIITSDKGEPVWTVTPLGKLENVQHRQGAIEKRRQV